MFYHMYIIGFYQYFDSVSIDDKKRLDAVLYLLKIA